MSGNTNAPWRDEETLRQKYLVEEKTQYEIADELGCSQNCIMRWLKRHNIEREYPWKDKETLVELYQEEGLTTYEIADEFDVSANAIQRQLKEHSIPRRHTLPHFKTRDNGYEVVRHQYEYEVTVVFVHRLTAVAHDIISPSEFMDENINVHHENGVKYDNRPENLESMKHAEHSRLHGEMRGGLNG